MRKEILKFYTLEILISPFRCILLYLSLFRTSHDPSYTISGRSNNLRIFDKIRFFFRRRYKRMFPYGRYSMETRSYSRKFEEFRWWSNRVTEARSERVPEYL